MEQKMEQKKETSLDTGLTSEEVSKQIQAGKQNLPVKPPGKTIGQIVFSNVFTYFNLIFAVLAAIVIAVGSYKSLTFLGAVIINMLVGIVQEIRSKRVTDRLNMLNAPRAKVLRDGSWIVIPTEELVEGDLVAFSAGAQICADGVLRKGEAELNESLLTGESDEVHKLPGDTLMSGSFVVSGECQVQLTAVGAESYISKLTIEAKKSGGVGQSEMINDLNRLVKVAGVAIIPIGIAMVLEEWMLLHHSIRTSVVSMTAALVGMIPEGLYLLATLRLVLSAMNLAKKRILIHQMNCIEALARVDVLCVDKTGTITEPDMKVKDLIPVNGCTEDLKVRMSDFAHAMKADNITMEAVKAFFQTPDNRKVLGCSSFSSEFKYSSVTFDDGCYVLGAPEFVLRSDYETIQGQIEQYLELGCRALVLARYDGRADGGALTGKASAVGILLIENPIRSGAAKTFGYFEEQGVEVKVISGDNPVTVSRIARQAGIHGAENYVDLSTYQGKEDSELDEAVRTYTVFGRVTPDQKRKLVHALKRNGKTVAMTGDGVNDVLALKDADCSIAMASGSDAAAHTAQLVLLDSDFSCMPQVVLEGRCVVNNIQRSASLFLVKNIFSFIMALLSLIFFFTYPMNPAQMSVISGLAIGAPAFLLALESNHNKISGRFITNVIKKALPGGLTDVLLVGILVIGANILKIPAAEVKTAGTIILMAVGLLIIYRISRPVNVYRIVIIVAMGAAAAFALTVLSSLFETVPLSGQSLILLAICLIAAVPALLGMEIALEKITAKKSEKSK